MTGDDIPWPSHRGAPPDEALSEEQAAALELALGDGFTVYGGMDQGARHSLDGLVVEPYFGAFVGSGGVAPTEPEFFQRLRSEGIPEDELLDEYEWYLDELVPEDAPGWRQTNPFNFDLKAIKAYFVAEFCSFMNLDLSEYAHVGYVMNYLDDFNPYTRIWFTIQIISEIDMYNLNLEYMKKGGNIASLLVVLAFRSCGSIGRMVEHYRWRFSYGPDAMRGRANLSAASSGGISRARAHYAKRQAVLARMAEYIAAGHSITRAATLTFKAGLGSSEGANRKRWNRRTKKK
jgi:hypothetical protein